MQLYNFLIISSGISPKKTLIMIAQLIFPVRDWTETSWMFLILLVIYTGKKKLAFFLFYWTSTWLVNPKSSCFNFSHSIGTSYFLLQNWIEASPRLFYLFMKRDIRNTRIFVVIIYRKAIIEMMKGGSINLNSSATWFLGCSGA